MGKGVDYLQAKVRTLIFQRVTMQKSNDSSRDTEDLSWASGMSHWEGQGNCKGFQRNISGVSGEERSRKVKSNGGKRAGRLQK